MTALRMWSGVLGIVVAFGYFAVFQRAIRYSIRKGETGRLALVIALSMRQVALAGVLAVLWFAGSDPLALLFGVLAGAMLYRFMLVCGWPPQRSEAPFVRGLAERGGRPPDMR